MLVLGLAIFTMLINVPLGMWRESVRKFSPSWFIAVHASVPLVIALRIWLDVTNWAIPFLIGIAILGQFIGSRVYRHKNAVHKVKKVSDKT